MCEIAAALRPIGTFIEIAPQHEQGAWLPKECGPLHPQRSP